MRNVWQCSLYFPLSLAFTSAFCVSSSLYLFFLFILFLQFLFVFLVLYLFSLSVSRSLCLLQFFLVRILFLVLSLSHSLSLYFGLSLPLTFFGPKPLFSEPFLFTLSHLPSPTFASLHMIRFATQHKHVKLCFVSFICHNACLSS